MEKVRRNIIKSTRRVVVKIGSAVLVGCPDIFARLAGEVMELKGAGVEVVIVSSGAVALGMKTLELTARPGTIPETQAVAAAGQLNLMFQYKKAFSEAGGKVAQILLTHDDLSDRRRFLNARNTVFALLKLGVVPVINENDTVAVEEIKMGDNDELAALATNLVEADLLVMLTDIDGLYDRDPKKDGSAKRIPVVGDVDKLEIAWLDKSAGLFGSGGMKSKTDAARKAAHFGAATIVTDGFDEGAVKKIFGLAETGTLFLPKEDRLTSRKHWIAFSTRPTGRVFLDEGAMEAVVKGKKSLLASGINGVDGIFEAGEVVHCVDSKGMELARGLINYSSEEVKKIKGLKSRNIENILGYKVYDEVIHRDNLVIL
ncbi:MAG: glutamate 5-kinase [Thermodesulfobacteriota bacterium]